mgnify:CR=1 FL=1
MPALFGLCCANSESPTMNTPVPTLQDCELLDQHDPLRPLRAQFELPPGVTSFTFDYFAGPEHAQILDDVHDGFEAQLTTAKMKAELRIERRA